MALNSDTIFKEVYKMFVIVVVFDKSSFIFG